MNAGIHDAHNLAWKLALALNGGNAEMLLNSYDAERYDAIVHNVDVATDRLTRIGISAPDWVRLIALRLANWAARFKSVQRRMAKAAGMLNLRYDQSDLIDRSGGRYLPDIALGDGVRLRSAIGTDGGLVELIQNGNKVCVGETTFELSEVAAQEIAKMGGPFFAVRPDHVIAYSGGSRETAEGYVKVFRI